MPRDGSGNYTLPAGNPVVSGTIIDVTWANPTMSDVAAAITDSLSRTGSGGMLVPFLNADGAVGSPGISWVNETTSGLYRAGLNDQRFSSSGVDKVQITADPSNPLLVWNVGDASFRPVLDTFSPATILGDWLFQGDLTMEGALVTDDSTLTRSGFNVPTGVEPTAPAQGDIWVEAANIFCRLNGVNESLIGSNAVGASGAADRMLRGDGAGGWVDIGSEVTMDAFGAFRTLGSVTGDSIVAMDFGGETLSLFVGATNGTIQVGGGPTYIMTPDTWRFEDDFYLQENGSFGPNVSGFAQLWIDNGPPQEFRVIHDDGQQVYWYRRGSFTLTMTGMTGSTPTVEYTINGFMINMYIPVADFGTQNSTAWGATGVPSIIRPAAGEQVTGFCYAVNSTSELVCALWILDDTGTFQFLYPTAGNANDYAAAWTASGTGGLPSGWCIQYMITDLP